MKQIRSLLLSLSLFTAIICNAQSKDFVAFMNNFQSLNFPLKLNQWGVENNKGLFSKGFTRDVYLTYLNEIKEHTTSETTFQYGGRTKYKGYDILLYALNDIGDAPALDTIKCELVVFNSAGKMLSKMIIAGQEPLDRMTDCVLNEDMTFEVSKYDEENQLISKENYFIDDDGKINNKSK